MKKINFHMHTTFSDGSLSLEQLLLLVSQNSVEEIAITDHDTIINLSNYIELENKYNIKIIPGIEIPTNIRKMHVLGYGIQNYNLIEDKLTNLKKYNEECNRETIDILRKNGMDINEIQVRNKTGCQYLTYRDIVKYIYMMGYVDEPRDAYRKYIGKGTKAYVPSKELDYHEVLNLIMEAKGISSLAHPSTIDERVDLNKLLPELVESGLSCIEIYSPRLTIKQLALYELLRKKYKLVKTVGTDFHNLKDNKIDVDIEDEELDEFHKKLLVK